MGRRTLIKMAGVAALAATMLSALPCLSTAETAKTPLFTAEERAYIAQGKPVTVGFNAERKPFSSYDAKTGAITGVCVDVMDKVAELSGLNFVYKVQAQGVETPALLASGDYDVICGVERDHFALNKTTVATEAFLESAVVPVCRKGEDPEISGNSSLTVAVPKAFQALKTLLEKDYPHLKRQEYLTNDECLRAVADGEAELFIQNAYLLGMLMQNPRFRNLKMLPLQVMTEHTAMALPRLTDTPLLSILNKSLACIDAAYIGASVIRHTVASPYQYTFGDFLTLFRGHVIVIAALVAVCFALLVVLLSLKRRNAAALQKQNQALVRSYSQTLIAHEPFELNPLLASLNAVYGAQCEQKGVTYKCRLIDLVDKRLVGDALRLNQVLANLLSNAVKYTEQGSVTLLVEQHIVTMEELYLHIAVEDTGCGMSGDWRARLWKPAESGGGLGLAAVKNLVMLMGGVVDAESRPGKGTTFTVDLPFERCLPKDARLAPANAESEK